MERLYPAMNTRVVWVGKYELKVWLHKEIVICKPPMTRSKYNYNSVAFTLKSEILTKQTNSA